MNQACKTILLFFSLVLTIQSCIEPQETFSKIPAGSWRGVLYLQDNPVVVEDKDEITYGQDVTGQLPFNFEVIYDNDSTFHIEIKNDTETIRIDDVTFGRTKSLAKDTVGIHFKVYDTYISALYEDDLLEGFWHVNYKENYKIRFRAKHGDNRRFILPVNDAQEADFDGRWSLIFDQGTEDAFDGVGVFRQDGKNIAGTIETETGDYRFMEGSVSGNKAYLSCFDGAHAFLVESKLLEDGTYSGLFYSGNAYVAPISGKKNPDAKLKDSYSISKPSSNSAAKFESFDSNKAPFSLDQENLKDKVKIMMLMGTWCPNCKDATEFLKEFSKKDEMKDVAITSVAFERYRDTSRVFEQISTYKSKGNIGWPVVLGGYYNKMEASKSFGLIDTIKAYPTLLLLDKSNVVRHVYTGFYGPATDQYEGFKSDFYSKIESLKNE